MIRDYDGASVQPSNGGGVSSDEEGDGGLRVSIDHINIISDAEEDEEMAGLSAKARGKARVKTPSRGGRGLRPVRVEREEHVERAVDVNTEASSNMSAELRQKAREKAAAEDDSLFVTEENPARDAGAEIGAPTPATCDGPRIKEEPTDGDVPVTEAVPHVSERALDDTTVTTRSDISQAKAPAKPRKRDSIKEDPKRQFQTEEERREWVRHGHDVEMLKKLLGSMNTSTADQDQDKEGKTDAVKDERSGRLFLIQFPPMTPNLIPSTELQDKTPHNGVEEGPTPESSAAGPFSRSAVPPATAATSVVPGEPAIKIEGGPNDATLDPMTTKPASVVTATNTQLPAGRVGKLHLHASGRTTIDWGGVSFELNRGSDVEFLQEAVVASQPARQQQEQEQEEGQQRAWAMSQVSGKFVVTPNWEKMLS
jgi:DNA-directed RNA polymerase III subunit RPC4